MYQIVPDPATITQVAALPDEVLDAYAEVLEVLQLTPWNGRPQHERNPEGAVRRWKFGVGQVGSLDEVAAGSSRRYPPSWAAPPQSPAHPEEQQPLAGLGTAPTYHRAGPSTLASSGMHPRGWGRHAVLRKMLPLLDL